MGIIIDIILVAILILSTFLGYKKGLVKLGAKLFAGIIAIVVTLILYRPIAGIIIKNTPIEANLKNAIITNASKSVENNKEENDENKISTQVTNQVAEQVKNEILPQEAEKIAQGVIFAITGILLFIIVKIALSIVITLLDFVANLPILKQFNDVGGLAYGLVRGAIIVCVIVLLLGIMAKMNPENNLNKNIEDSHITKIIYEKIVKF